MKKNRAVRWLVGAVAATVLLLGASAGAGVAPGVAQTSCTDPNYCPIEPTAPTGTTSPAESKALALKKCINKAKTKFGDNAVKRKAAIKKCKKKFR